MNISYTNISPPARWVKIMSRWVPVVPPPPGLCANWWRSRFGLLLSSSILITLSTDFVGRGFGVTGLYSFNNCGDLFFGTGTITDAFHRLGTLWSWRKQSKMSVKNITQLCCTVHRLFLFLILGKSFRTVPSSTCKGFGSLTTSV